MENNIKKYLPTKLAGYVGFIVQAVVNNFLPILFIVFRNVYNLSYEKLGRLILVNFVTQMFVDLLTPKIVEKAGYRKTAIMSQLFAAIGLISLGILPNLISDTYFAIVISVIIYASGSGITEVILSPMIDMLPTGNKSGNMAVLHSFYCWGQAFTVLGTTALVSVFGYHNWQYIPLIWAAIPFLNTFSFLKVPIVEPSPDQKTATFAELIKKPLFLLYMLMMLCAGASEIAMAQWASIFAQNALGVSKVIGDIAGPCAFALFMGTGRVVYAKFSKKVSFTKLLIFLNVLCFVCYIVVGFCKISFVALIFCAICGFTVSISWPGIYSAGARTFKNGGAVMFSVFAMSGDTGCAVGPWIIGIFADRFGLNVGFAVASVFPLLMVLCGLYILKLRSCQREK